MHVNEWVLLPCEDYDREYNPENVELVLKMWLMLYAHVDRTDIKEFLKKNRPRCRLYSDKNKQPVHYYLLNGCSIMGDVFLLKEREYGEWKAGYPSISEVELGTFDVRVPPEDIFFI